jgi:hypothetical protein
VDRSETGSSEPPHRLEVLLGLASTKTDALEKALERTWIAHVVIAGIGIAMVLKIGQVLQAIAGHYSLQGASDLKTVAPIMLAIYLYYFMKTGSLLTAFNEAKALRDRLLKDYLEGQPEEGTVGPLHETTSFLAAAFYDDEPGLIHATGGPWWQWKLGRWVPYFFITALVVSLAQAAALFLAFEAYHGSPRFWLVAVIVVILVIVLDIMFWKPAPSTPTTTSRSIRPSVREIRNGEAEGTGSPGKAQRAQARRSLAVRVLLGSVIFWVALFTFLHRDNPTQDKVDQAQRPACCEVADAPRPSPSH